MRRILPSSQSDTTRPGERIAHADTNTSLALLSGFQSYLEVDPHGRRTAWLALRLWQVMDRDHYATSLVVAAAATHDIGKLFIPALIRQKRGALTSSETAVMRYHTLLGHDVLEGLRKRGHDAFDFALQAEVALMHHERWDGGGYPMQLIGQDIPLMARVTSVADVFDALTSARSYKPSWPLEQAVEFVLGERGRRFDPDCVDAFAMIADDLIRHWDRVAAALCQAQPAGIPSPQAWEKWILSGPGELPA